MAIQGELCGQVALGAQKSLIESAPGKPVDGQVSNSEVEARVQGQPGLHGKPLSKKRTCQEVKQTLEWTLLRILQNLGQIVLCVVRPSH